MGLELQLLIKDELKFSVSKESCGNTSLAFETHLRATFFLEQRVGAVTRGDHTPSQHRTASSHLRFPRLSAGSILGPSFTPSPPSGIYAENFCFEFCFSRKVGCSPGFMTCAHCANLFSPSISCSKSHSRCNFHILEGMWKGEGCKENRQFLLPLTDG